MPRRALAALALACGAAALFFTSWIVVPAPSYNFWLVAVGASEWSLWFGALGLAGAVFGLLARAAGGGRAPTGLALIAGVASVLLSLFPPLAAWREARARDLRLSLGRYVIGAPGGAKGGRAPATFTYATPDGRELKLDAYLPPAEQAQPRAAVVVVHGGSWSAGGRGDFPRWNRWLASEGYAVFDVDYRLAPQPNWQTATGDVKCAVGWVRENARRLNVDPQRVALMGRSAGGHLALLAAYSAGEPRLPPTCAVADEGVRAVVSFYGVTDLAWAYAHPANQRVIDGPATLRRFTGGTPDGAAEIYRLASPVSHVDERTTPTLLFHGGRDQLVRGENMEMLAARLAAARVPSDAVSIAYAQHGFDYNFDGWGAQIARPLIAAFLRAHLGPPK
ncbi:MAG TPA: alpha/beta hydrolase [Pyrinomonadaceae bacterium]|jgi:acetyl esterase/lipase